MTYTFDENMFSDLYKDTYGFRPHGHEFYTSSNDEKQKIWDHVIDAMGQKFDEDVAMEQEAIASFENKIRDLINIGANTRKNAIKWFIDSMNLSDFDKMYGGEYICYHLGLPFSMKSIFDNVINHSQADEFGMDESLYRQCMDRIEYQDTYGYVYV